MSRSYKKHPACSTVSCKENKRRANKRVRSLLKNSDVSLDNARFKRAYESWDIRDWREAAPSFEHFYQWRGRFLRFKRGRYVFIEQPTRKDCLNLYRRWYVRK